MTRPRPALARLMSIIHRVALCVALCGALAGCGAATEAPTASPADTTGAAWTPQDVSADDAAATGGTSDAASDATSDAGGPADAMATGDAQPTPDGVAKSRCEVSAASVRCPYQTHTLATGFLGLEWREVHFQVPLGTPPAAGWPVAILFQGSLFSGELAWLGLTGAPFGMRHQVDTVRSLLDAGFAVLTPEAHLQGTTFWDTNIPPYAALWSTAPDHAFMQAIFAAIDAGKFGPLDGKRLYGLGISSGGYMTSRMALSYPGRFRALAIHSASWATCAGPVCLVPSALPADHPPTLFAHGALDAVVPLATMTPYRDKLISMGVATESVVVPAGGHEWLAAATAAIAPFFAKHP